MTKKLGKPITFEEAVQRAKSGNHTLEETRNNYAQIVAQVEADYGPHVPALFPRRGRPHKDAVVEVVETKSIKMSPAFWRDFETKAESAGMNMHAAMRAALVEWASRHRAS